ncbi:type II secretion system F family protein [Anatilimnocola sp. NA78]|uniref:type II secretion system F family protein n=1 Tax=Anatilimnocola sp. NA78 TaxID=3415683 RepID=UPI003CE47286
MKPATLHDYLELSDQLAALAAADVPLAGGFDVSSSALQQSLAETNAGVARRMAEGQTLEQALGAEPNIPPGYRSLIEVALRSENRAAAFAEQTRTAQAVERSVDALQVASYYPLILGTLAYSGLIVLCLFLIPRLEQFYIDLQLTGGSGLSALRLLRDTLPVWAVAIPLLVLGSWLLLRRARFSRAGTARVARWTWVPGMTRILREQAWSSFAESTASLLKAGMPLNAALPLAADSLADRAAASDLKQLASELHAGEVPASSLHLTNSLPPFLRWALVQSEPTMPRVDALQLAAGLYYESAERRSERLRSLAPIIASLLLGGGVTLLYGLALFVPLAQLLQTVAAPHRI